MGAAILLPLALAGSAGATGCGGDSTVDKSEVTIEVRSEGSAERRLLSQIYAQALKIAGYRVKKGPETLETKIGIEGVKSGQIDGYPQYISTSLFYDFEVPIENIRPETKAAYGELKRDLEKQGMTAFPPTPYSIANAVGMLRKTAEKRHLRNLSDLKGQAEEMTLKGPSYCHVSVECLAGIERHYDTAFEGFSSERALTPELTWYRGEPNWRYEVLEKGISDASILYNTDGRLQTEKGKFVVLEDDEHIFPASNFVWVTSQEVADEAGPGYEKAIVDAQKGLTLGIVRRLNTKIESGESPAKVAAEYLKAIGYAG